MAERLTEEQIRKAQSEQTFLELRELYRSLKRENAEQRAEIERLKDELNQPVILSEWQHLQARVRELEGQQQGLIVERDQLLEEKREMGAELAQAEKYRDLYSAVSVAMGDREGDVWRSTHDLPQRVATLRQQLAEAQSYETRLASLLTELWDGVRAHGLEAPKSGRDGERLIHAYCGGIAKLRLRAEAAEQREKRLREALVATNAHLEAGIRETQSSHDQPPEPADEWSYSAVVHLVANRALLADQQEKE